MDGVGEGALLTSFVEVENKRSTRRERGGLRFVLGFDFEDLRCRQDGCTGSSHEFRNKGQYVQGYTHSTAISIYLTYVFIEAETTVLHGQNIKY